MSKSLIISLLSIMIGLVTIAVGLYVLSTTPAPAPAPETGASNDPFLMVPQRQTTDATGQDVPSLEATPGSEPWCEQLMLLPDDRWTDQDARLFAQHCVYQ
ncbi:DUF3012 domain-containing protein [Gilvimarinus polysaccharolyticus]|uniref:DUF3012 domain-containing protein n=1 Tax=Gilvimarinus polysaccharolyticus TaxID=863921 RepID=UPI0006736EA2|nr:DUF3012 domain-containing protein [Gilvimarinus polysaccharolyticus]